MNFSTAPYLHNFSSVEYISAENAFFWAIWDKSAYIWCNFSTMIFLKIEAETASFNGAIWDEFSEHQSSKKAPYSRLKFNFFGANKVYIQCSMHSLVGISLILLSRPLNYILLDLK